MLVDNSEKTKFINYKSVKGDRWALEYDACINCGSTETTGQGRYCGKGLCRRCASIRYLILKARPNADAVELAQLLKEKRNAYTPRLKHTVKPEIKVNLPTGELKVCSDCKKTKDLIEFFRSYFYIDNYYPACVSCLRKRVIDDDFIPSVASPKNCDRCDTLTAAHKLFTLKAYEGNSYCSECHKTLLSKITS